MLDWLALAQPAPGKGLPLALGSCLSATNPLDLVIHAARQDLYAR